MAVTDTFYPSKDLYIRCNETETANNTNYSTDADLRLEYRTYSTGRISRLLLAFDISSLSGKTITSAILNLNYYLFSEWTTKDTYVNRLTRDWTFDTVTWNKYDGTNTWTTAGGDFTTTDRATLNIDSTTGWRQYNVTDIVQSWLNGTNSNYGFLVNCAAGGSTTNEAVFAYSSRVAGTSNDPYLTITYSAESSSNSPSLSPSSSNSPSNSPSLSPSSSNSPSNSPSNSSSNSPSNSPSLSPSSSSSPSLSPSSSESPSNSSSDSPSLSPSSSESSSLSPSSSNSPSLSPSSSESSSNSPSESSSDSPSLSPSSSNSPSLSPSSSQSPSESSSESSSNSPSLSPSSSESSSLSPSSSESSSLSPSSSESSSESPSDSPSLSPSSSDSPSLSPSSSSSPSSSPSSSESSSLSPSPAPALDSDIIYLVDSGRFAIQLSQLLTDGILYNEFELNN